MQAPGASVRLFRRPVKRSDARPAGDFRMKAPFSGTLRLHAGRRGPPRLHATQRPFRLTPFRLLATVNVVVEATETSNETVAPVLRATLGPFRAARASAASP